MSIVTVSKDYRITLPKDLCVSMHVKPGQEFEIIPVGAIIHLVPKASIKELRGIAYGANPTPAQRDIG